MNRITNGNGALWQLYVDGAARNNPGPAGAGIYLLKNGQPIEQVGIFLGNKTNNQAEYLALFFGLLYAKQYIKQDDLLVINSDSQLLVRQITGAYSVKNPIIKRIYNQLGEHLSSIKYTIVHIPREQNKIADKLANMGIDKKLSIPPQFLTIWHAYEQTS
jgi:ribonuclease HI